MFISYLLVKLFKGTSLQLPWNQAVSSLQSCGVQLEKGRDVVAMRDGDQAVHDLLARLTLLLRGR